MEQIGTAVAADAINKVIVAPLLQQIDDVIHLDQNRGILQAKLNRMKLLLQDICNGFQNQQRTPPDSIRDCLESTRDAVAEAKSLIDRSQLQQRCLDCIFCKPRISRQIREWNTRFDQLLQELRTLFSIFAHAEQIGSSSAQPPAKETLQPLPEWGIVGMDIKSAETQLQTLINAESLPKDFVCTQLVSLILTKNPFRCNVPQSFLINLVSLRVLDLSYTRIESVPTSLGQLRLLEFLSLRGTGIKELPEEICNLSKLQFLDLGYCDRLSSLPSMIGKLTQLKFLSLWGYDLVVPLEISQLTSLKKLYLDIRTETNVMALQGLSNLIELCLNIYVEFEGHEIMGTWLQMRHLWLYSSNINTLPSGLQNNMVNTLPSGMQNIKELQSLRVWSMQGFNLPNWICEFQHLERLELRYCQKVEALPPLERLPNLKFLKVCNCDMLRDLGIGSSGKAVGFPMLERLDLIDLPEMVTLSCHEGVLKEGMLPKLRVLKIKDCPELRKLPMDMEKLPHLKALYCHRIWWENIIWEDNNMKMYFDKLFEEI